MFTHELFKSRHFFQTYQVIPLKIFFFLPLTILRKIEIGIFVRNKLIGDRYRIKSRLGEGGMATVYLALDEKLGRKVAIKILHAHLTENKDICNRFHYEARSISSLDHPNIIKVYDFSGSQSKSLWIVTEIVQGQDIDRFISSVPEKTLHPILAVCLVREISKALNAAHQKGLVLRDIKPENVMITANGKVKLMDFGIAKNMQTSNKTQTGTFMGSPSYMSPEQIRGSEVDLRSDIFSLGVVFYEVLTGTLPFSGNTAHDVIMKVIDGKYQPISELRPKTPEEIISIVDQCLASDPAERFQQTGELARRIDSFLSRQGFVESHVELERYFLNPNLYLSKLESIDLQISSRGKEYSSDIKKASASSGSPTSKKVGELRSYAAHNQNALRNQSVKVGTDRWNQLQKIAEESAPSPFAPRRDHRIPPKPLRSPRSVARREAIKNIPMYAGVARHNKKRTKPRIVSRDQRFIISRNIQRQMSRRRNQSIFLNIFLSILLIALVFVAKQLYVQNFQINPTIQKRTTGKVIKNRRPEKKKIINRKQRKAPNSPIKRIAQPTKSKTPSSKSTASNKRKANKTTVPQKNLTRSNWLTSKPENKLRPSIKRKGQDTLKKQETRLKNVEKISKDVPTTRVTKVEKQPTNKIVVFSVQSFPSSEVFMNGKRLGTTIRSNGSTSKFKLPNKAYDLSLKRAGYETYTKRVDLSLPSDRKLWSINLLKKYSNKISLDIISRSYPFTVVITNDKGKTVHRTRVNSPKINLQVDRGMYHIKATKGRKVINKSIYVSEDIDFDVNFESRK